MKCPPELFKKLEINAKCHYCGHTPERHGGEANCGCSCGKCDFFEITPGLKKQLEAVPGKCYDITYRWHEINPRLMALELPPRLVRFASFMSSLKGLEYDSNYFLWHRISKKLNVDHNPLRNVGDLVIGRVTKDYDWSLVLGEIKGDSLHSTLPSMILSPEGLRYEVDGVVVANHGPKALNGLWGWPSLICGDVIKIEEFSAVLEAILEDIPYKVVKEILG